MPIKSILLDVHGRPPPSGLLTLTPEPQNSRITPKERAPQGFLACLVVSLGGHFHASTDGADQRSSRDLLRAAQGPWLRRSPQTACSSGDSAIPIKPSRNIHPEHPHDEPSREYVHVM